LDGSERERRNMSFPQRNVASSKKRKVCPLCGTLIEIGSPKVVRNGVDGSDFWTMHMHPECEAYESRATVDDGWYEDCYEPAFERSEAIEFVKAKGEI
jgi:hypothetical protein